MCIRDSFIICPMLLMHWADNKLTLSHISLHWYASSCCFVCRFACLKVQSNLTSLCQIIPSYLGVHFLSGHSVHQTFARNLQHVAPFLGGVTLKMRHSAKVTMFNESLDKKIKFGVNLLSTPVLSLVSSPVLRPDVNTT